MATRGKPGSKATRFPAATFTAADRIPALQGKYIFGEITTGQLFYCDYAEMLAADDNDPNTMAEIHSINILWDDPNNAPNEGEEQLTGPRLPAASWGRCFRSPRPGMWPAAG